MFQKFLFFFCYFFMILEQVFTLFTLAVQTKETEKKKINFKFLWLTWAKKISFKTVSHKPFLTINVNRYPFGSKIGQTKHKPLRTKYFLSFFVRNCGLCLKHLFVFVFSKMNTKNRTLLCKSNSQILKFLKVINTM